jgi:hypothetical protein
MKRYKGFEVSPRVLSANPANIAEYIRAQLAKDELTRWTVAIAAGKSGEKLQVPEAEELPLIQRIPITGQSRVQATECEVGVLVSPAHEALGLPVKEADAAFRDTEQEFRERGKGTPKRASGQSLRSHRDPAEGLLLVYPIDPVASTVPVETQGIPIVGYAVSFPRSETARKSGTGSTRCSWTNWPGRSTTPTRTRRRTDDRQHPFTT